jgi:hypothetical protein
MNSWNPTPSNDSVVRTLVNRLPGKAWCEKSLDSRQCSGVDGILHKLFLTWALAKR